MVGLRNSNSILFAIAVSMLLLHLFRNISPIYFILHFIVIISAIIGLRKHISDIDKIVLFFVFLSINYIILISYLSSAQYGDPVIGIIRLFYIVPHIILFFLVYRTEKQSIFIWKLLCVFSILAALSIPFQMYFGPISWFASPGERAGVVRYSSLAGSLTAFGSFVGASFFGTFVLYKGFVKFILLAILIICSILSLQKAAIGGVIVALLVLIRMGYFKVTTFKFCILLSFLFSVVLFVKIFNYIPEFTLPFLSNVFGYGDPSTRTDVTILHSIIDRFTELPLQSIETFGIYSLFTGVGVFGGSGGLGYPEYPMMHNLIGEIVIIFGIPLSIFILYFVFNNLAFSFYSLKKQTKCDSTQRVLASGMFFLIVTVSFFSGGLFYQPIMGAFFWFSLSELVHLKALNGTI